MKYFQLIASVLFFILFLSACCKCPPKRFSGSFPLEHSSRQFFQIDLRKRYLFRAVDSSNSTIEFRLQKFTGLDTFAWDAFCLGLFNKPISQDAEGGYINLRYVGNTNLTPYLQIFTYTAAPDTIGNDATGISVEDALAEGLKYEVLTDTYYSIDFSDFRIPDCYLCHEEGYLYGQMPWDFPQVSIHLKNSLENPLNTANLPYSIVTDTLIDGRNYQNLIIHPNIDLDKFRISTTKGFMRFYDQKDNVIWELDSIY